MDFNNDKEPCGWQKEVNCFQKASNFDISQELWSEVPQNEHESSHMLDDGTTPVKACGDLAYHAKNSDNMLKEPEECRETSLLKRRRMLQFHSNDVHVSLSNEETSSAYSKLNGKEDLVDDVFLDMSQWVPGTSGSASASSYEDLELSAEGWLAECFNDTELEINPNYMNLSWAGDVQSDVAGELHDTQPAHEQHVVQQHVTRSHRNIVFKGRKSMMQMPRKLATPVAYPFAFIKPSGAQGDVTLKEINQRIQTPMSSKPKPKIEDPSSYPKSAFSGKPVIGKTKIRTEGGKGSITIMRTKG